MFMFASAAPRIILMCLVYSWHFNHQGLCLISVNTWHYSIIWFSRTLDTVAIPKDSISDLSFHFRSLLPQTPDLKSNRSTSNPEPSSDSPDDSPDSPDSSPDPELSQNSPSSSSPPSKSSPLGQWETRSHLRHQWLFATNSTLGKRGLETNSQFSSGTNVCKHFNPIPRKQEDTPPTHAPITILISSSDHLWQLRTHVSRSGQANWSPGHLPAGIH